MSRHGRTCCFAFTFVAGFVVCAASSVHAAVATPPRTGLSCTASIPQPANINELSDVDSGAFFDFIEVKILQSGVDIAGWKLCTARDKTDPVCAAMGVGDGDWNDGAQTGRDNSSSLKNTTFQDDTWITYSDKDVPGLRAQATRGEAILVDATGAVLDHIRYSRNDSCTSQGYWEVPSACSACLTLSNSANNKVLARMSPDGTGDWVDTGEDPTPGTGNDGGVGGGVDHYAISHPELAVSCQSVQVTITAHNGLDQAIDPGAQTLSLATSTGRGKWVSVVSGSGVLSNNQAFDGVATYQFPGNGESSVTLVFNYPELLSDPERVNIDLSDGSATDRRNATNPEDTDLSVALSGFLFSAVPTQIAGKNSDLGWNRALLQLQAVKASDSDPNACAALFSGPVTIELGAECHNPATCLQTVLVTEDDGSLATAASPTAALATSADNAAPLTSAYSALDLTFDASARTFIAINYPDAGLLQLHARYELRDENGVASGQFMYGSSNDFVVRPFALGFTNIDDGGAPAVVNPGGIAPAGPGFVAAASPFQFDLGGYRYADGEDGDGDGQADAGVDVTDNGVTANFSADAAVALGAITPAGGSNGVLTATTASLSGGMATDRSARYNEVGSVTLLGSVANYLGAADADVVGVSPVIGRFYPASLVLLGGSTVQGACNNFSYMDAPSLAVDFTVEARNQEGVRTQHYDQLLMGGDSSLAFFDGHAENAADGIDRGARLSGLVGSWIAGQYSVSSSSVSFARIASPDGPFDDLQLSISVINPLPESLALSGAVGSPPASDIGAPVQVRYGRLSAENAFGPETEALPQPLRVEYFDGSGFVTHGLDDCSSIGFSQVQMNGLALDPMPASIPLDSGLGATSPGFSLPLGMALGFSGGDAGLLYSAPGAGDTGAVMLQVDLGGMRWLQFDWDRDGTADAAMRPATATFGHYRGNDRVLFWEENLTR